MNMIQFENQFGQFLIRLVFVPLSGLDHGISRGRHHRSYLQPPASRNLLANALGRLSNYLIPISLGLFTGFKVNRKTSVLADFFPWFGPAILFIYIYFSADPWDSTGERGLLGRNCGDNECLNAIFITTPLLFSLGYSCMTLLLRLTDRLRRTSANA
jgi:hypothetical protein